MDVHIHVDAGVSVDDRVFVTRPEQVSRCLRGNLCLAVPWIPSTMNEVRLAATISLLSITLGGCARSTGEAVEVPAPTEEHVGEDPAELESAPADASLDEDRAAKENAPGDASTEHVTFEDEVDAREGPADSVVAQPQRDPMPSMLDPKKWGPR